MNPRDLIKNDITIIKGDACFRDVIITGAEPEIIEGVYFTCSDLQISKNLEYDSERKCYCLRLESEETAQYNVMVTDYDITIKFFDDSYRTVIYRGKMSIMEKHNPVEV